MIEVKMEKPKDKCILGFFKLNGPIETGSRVYRSNLTWAQWMFCLKSRLTYKNKLEFSVSTRKNNWWFLRIIQGFKR